MFGFRKNRLIVPLLAASLLGAGVWTQANAQGRRGGDADGMGPMGNMQRLHDKLNLSASQEELWKKAQAASKEAFQKLRAGGREQHERMRAEIDKPGADMKQVMELGDQMRAQMETTRKQIRAAWLPVYDSLDANQKEQVRLAVKDGMGRMHRGGRKGGPHGEQGGEHEHG
jgi:protein CpxP